MTSLAAVEMTTSLIILHPSELRLLCIYHPTFARWMFPGGRVQLAEAPHQTVLREIAEEVGLSVRLCDMSALPVWDDGTNRRLAQPFAVIEERAPGHNSLAAFVDFVFVGIACHDRLTLNAEVLKAAWCDRCEIAALNTTYPIQALAEAVFDDTVRIREKVEAI